MLSRRRSKLSMSNTPQSNLARIAGYAATGGYVVLAAVTLAWGAYERFHIPQAPIVDPDIRGYLGPAIYALTGHGFTHMDGRSFPYPAFVLVILRLFGDFRAHFGCPALLGVGAGALTLLAWNALLRLVPPGGIPRQLSRYIGLGPAAIYLGSATAIHFEQEIRPEAIFPFLAILNLLVSFLFIHSRFIRPQSFRRLAGRPQCLHCRTYLSSQAQLRARNCSSPPRQCGSRCFCPGSPYAKNVLCWQPPFCRRLSFFFFPSRCSSETTFGDANFSPRHSSVCMRR